jgi:L,D-peptidoglycan transpeptidase YkuD (ErfK/YbiS/YcfS/YnhG family)
MDMFVTARSISPQLGTLSLTTPAGQRTVKCALGRSGIVADKREGDGCTPIGRFPLRRVLYRADRLTLPATAMPAVAIEPGDGWCDDPASPDYNRQVRLPISASHEHLWRLDEIYDIVVVLGHNDDPPVAGAGSAIFLHVARPDYAPTQGCVAIARADLLQLLADCGAENSLTVSRG